MFSPSIKKMRYPPAIYIGQRSPRLPLGLVRQITAGTYKAPQDEEKEDQKAA